MLLEDFLKKVVAETLAEPSLRNMLRKKANLGEDAPIQGQGFSLDVLRSKLTLKEARAYVRETLGKELGRGHARGAWAIDDKTIIKVVLGTKLYSNENEVKNAKCVGEQYAVKIIEYHPEFWWIIQENVLHVDEEEFLSLFFTSMGIDQSSYEFFDSSDVAQAIEIAQSGRTESQYPEDFIFRKLFNANQIWMKTPWYRGLIANLQGCRVGSDDFPYNNWGQRPATKQLVLLDLGFSA